jgi:hypothetical protein
MTGDFNADGAPDIGSANLLASTVSILLGNGDGTFQPHLDFSTGTEPIAIASGDFNGDGRLDLISANYSSNTLSVLLQQAGVTFSPPSLTFATQLITTSSAPQVVTLTNGSGSALSITGVSIGGTGASSFSETNTCDSSVPPEGTCTISVTFSPQAQGLLTASVTVNTGGGGGPSFAVSGTGTESGLFPAGLDFGNVPVGSTSTKNVTLRNTGTTFLRVLKYGFIGTDRKDFSQTNNCDGSLAPKHSCQFAVTFKPSAQGARSAEFALDDTGTGVGGFPQNVPLLGNGT